MGQGLIILGLFSIGSVISGNSKTVYDGVTGVINDSRILPTAFLIIVLLWLGNLSNSKGWKTLTRSLSVLIAIAVIFSLQKNPYQFLPSFLKGDKNG